MTEKECLIEVYKILMKRIDKEVQVYLDNYIFENEPEPINQICNIITMVCQYFPECFEEFMGEYFDQKRQEQKAKFKVIKGEV